MDTPMLPPLPKAVFPTFEDTLPISKMKFKYRAFNVREQRSILTGAETAKQAKDMTPMINAVLEVLRTTTGMDAAKLSTTDMEYMILKSRGASIDNEAKFAITDPDSGEVVTVKFKIDDFEVKIPESFTTDIRLDELTILQMRLPNMHEIAAVASSQEHLHNRTSTLAMNCIERVISGDTVYDMTQYNKQEKIDFLESLSDDGLAKISQFFENAPKITRDIPYVLSTGEKKTLTIEGLNHFFH